MKKFQGTFLALIAGSLLFAPSVFADTTSHIRELQSSLDSTNSLINSDQQKQKSIEAQAASLQATIDEISQKMDDNQRLIASKQREIQGLNQQIKDNQDKLQKLQDAFNTQLRTLYEHGSVSYLSVLFDATSFDDFLSRFDSITMIADQNKKMEEEMKQLRQQLDTQHKQVQSSLEETKQKQTELSILQQTNAKLKAQQDAQADALQAKIDKNQAQADDLQAQIDFAKQELLYSQQSPVSETNAGSASSGTTVALNGDVGGLISYAEQFIGTPYAWGGTQPGGFDCSGYTSYVFSHFGIPMNRTAQAQFGQGVAVSSPQPGDLVFFSTYAPGASHVGIYIGSGMFINAENNGVKISSLSNPYWGPRYIGARRVIK
ncbi:MAG: C40 family peptidase [Tumebacillaceae bacterium]